MVDGPHVGQGGGIGGGERGDEEKLTKKMNKSYEWSNIKNKIKVSNKNN